MSIVYVVQLRLIRMIDSEGENIRKQEAGN